MGKSAVAKHFAAYGFPVFDADACVHKLYARPGPAVDAVASIYPTAFKNGAICRKELSVLIQKDQSNSVLRQLENIMHPLVLEEREHFYRAACRHNHFCVVYDIPLLFEGKSSAEEAKRNVRADYVVVATAHENIQRRRVLERANMTEDKFHHICGRQLGDAEKRAWADYVVYTDRYSRSAGEKEEVEIEAVGFTAAKAQVAAVVEDIVCRHPELWEQWRTRSVVTALDESPGSTAVGDARGDGGGVVDTVVFDLDDTLLSFSPIIRRASVALLQHMQTQMPRTYAGLLERQHAAGAADAEVSLESTLNVTLKTISER